MYIFLDVNDFLLKSHNFFTFQEEEIKLKPVIAFDVGMLSMESCYVMCLLLLETSDNFNIVLECSQYMLSLPQS